MPTGGVEGYNLALSGTSLHDAVNEETDQMFFSVSSSQYKLEIEFMIRRILLNSVFFLYRSVHLTG